MSVKAANTCAAHNDGVAFGVDGRQNMTASAPARHDDHFNKTEQRLTAEVFGGVLPMQRPLGVG
jgi:hypothetical protein